MTSFENSALEDYQQWATTDKKVWGKINKLIAAIQRDPFRGIGKPEPLKGDKTGYWSRRITDEHRLIYKALAGQIVIVACKGHYE